MAEGGGATDEMVEAHLETRVCLGRGRGGVGGWGGSHDSLHGCRCLCLLGSLSLYRILKITFFDCIPIKMNIIQAGFSIMYSLLLYLFFLLILEK